MAAIGIIMHKILRIIYGMLKNNTTYDPQVDQANREQKRIQNISQNRTKENRHRRYQHYDSDAPISQRQAKKRKQNDNIADNQEVSNKNEKNAKVEP